MIARPPSDAPVASLYCENGFALVDGLFSTREIASICSSAAALEARAASAPTPEFSFERGAPGVLRRTFRPLDLDPSLEFLLEHEPLLDLIEACVGPAIELFASKVVWKPPRSGNSAPWHQDLPFFRHSNSSLVTACIHLDDFRDSQGVLRFMPGSHRNGVLQHVRGALAGEDLARCEASAVDGAVGMGGITLHHSLTAHAARSNGTDRMRKRLLLTYRAADCVSLEAPLPEIYGSHSGCRVRGAPLPPRYEPLEYQADVYAD